MMQAVGLTTPREVYVCSKTRKFRKKELLVIEDQGGLIGEVMETQCYNHYLPLSLESGFIDQSVLLGLRAIGYNIDDEQLSLAKVCLLEEAPYPISTGSLVRVPCFSEVTHLLLATQPEAGLLLGEIKGTEDIAQGMMSMLLDQMLFLEKGEYRRQKGVPFVFPIKEMQQYPHMGIFGGSGSGKSFALRVMLEELMKLEIPTLVFDPHYEMDFGSNNTALPLDLQTDYGGRFVIYQIGQEVGVDFAELSTRDLSNLLDAAARLTEHMSNALQVLHKRKDAYFLFSTRLQELASALEKGRNRIERLLAEDTLSREERDVLENQIILLQDYPGIQLATVNALFSRLRTLYYSGLFNHGIRCIVESIAKRKLVVLRGSLRIMQVFASYVLSNLYYRRREYRDGLLTGKAKPFFPPFLTATDEAHNFAPRGYDSAAKNIIKEIAQEGRKYGVFLLLATQRPALLDETTTAQLNTKLIFRTVRASDMAIIKEETDLSAEEAKSLPYLVSGDAYISSAIWGRTMAVRIRAAKTTSLHTENPFDELSNREEEREAEFLRVIQEKLPLDSSRLLTVLPDISRALGGEPLEITALKEKLDDLVQKGKLARKENPFLKIIFYQAFP